MKIDTSSMLFNPQQILIIEETRNMRYICETCLKMKNGNWLNQPAAIFWQDTPHPQGSNYAALLYGGDGSQLVITDGISATQDEFAGVLAPDNVVYYSRYRNDFRNIPGGFIDGGRDYIRSGDQVINYPVVKLKIVGPELMLVAENLGPGELTPKIEKAA